jgi:vacuolar protein sorting-associated protein 41
MASAAPGDAIEPAEPPVTPLRAQAPATPEESPADGPGSHAVEKKAEVGEEGEQDEDEDEPRLKYHRLTGSLSSVYRNGDATSCFLVSGDKMVLRQP